MLISTKTHNVDQKIMGGKISHSKVNVIKHDNDLRNG